MHMYKCDPKCYEFNNGHICKHIHRVYSLEMNSDLQPQHPEHENSEDDTINPGIELSYAESIFHPVKGCPHYMYSTWVHGVYHC